MVLLNVFIFVCLLLLFVLASWDLEKYSGFRDDTWLKHKLVCDIFDMINNNAQSTIFLINMEKRHLTQRNIDP